MLDKIGFLLFVFCIVGVVLMAAWYLHQNWTAYRKAVVSGYKGTYKEYKNTPKMLGNVSTRILKDLVNGKKQ